jgi:hypothetical protein
MFTKKYYSGKGIAVNDIGAIGYFTNVRVIDIWGLANKEVTKSKRQQYWTPEFLDSFCKLNRVEVAIIYDSWFPAKLTEKWSKAATWEIQNNVICGDKTVSFYVLNPILKYDLRQKLITFQSQLPSSVAVKYY